MHTGNHGLHITLGEDDCLDMFPLAERLVQGRREERVCTFLGLSAGELVFGLPWVGYQILRIHTSDEIGIFHIDILAVLRLLVAAVSDELPIKGVRIHADVVLVIGLEQRERLGDVVAVFVLVPLFTLLALLVRPSCLLDDGRTLAVV